MRHIPVWERRLKGLMTKFLLDIPYFSQWESKELVEDFVEGKKSAKTDPRWKLSGAKTLNEYDMWSWNVCGMTCFKMVLAKKLGKEHKTIKMARECEKYGGYKVTEKEIEGLYYDPFVIYVKDKFGLEAKVIRNFLTVSKIKRELVKGSFPIVSVNWRIRNPESRPEKKGGHLVLMTGFDNSKKTLFLHNPSGFYKQSQENFEITEKDFKKFFAGRGILIY